MTLDAHVSIHGNGLSKTHMSLNEIFSPVSSPRGIQRDLNGKC